MLEAISEELDKLPANVNANFWWRDDDATESHPNLLMIIQLARSLSVRRVSFGDGASQKRAERPARRLAAEEDAISAY